MGKRAETLVAQGVPVFRRSVARALLKGRGVRAQDTTPTTESRRAAMSRDSRPKSSQQERRMDPLFLIGGITLGLYLLHGHRPRVRLSDAHKSRREQIVSSWRERDRAAAESAQRQASVVQLYGPLTEAQRETYRDV